MKASIEFMWSADVEGNVKQWSLREDRCLKIFTQVHNSEIILLELGIDGLSYYTGDDEGFVKKWSIMEQRILDTKF